MILLGIDPGETTGWCRYAVGISRGEGKVVAAGCFTESAFDAHFYAELTNLDVIVIERPVPHGPTFPQVVTTAWHAGIISGTLQCLIDHKKLGACTLATPTRLEIKEALQAMTLGEIDVRKDKGVWQALLHLHGGDKAGKKGGPLYGIHSHQRAALAACVAWRHLMRPTTKVG